MRLSAVTCMDTCRPSTFSWSRSTHVGAFSSPLNTVSFFFLNVPLPESEITLAKLVVLFQGRDSRIFGPCVRYVALPCRLQWCFSDDILDPSLPPRKRGLAPNTVYLRTQLCSLTCHIFHAYFRGYASFIWTPTTPSYHPMRHPCTVVVVVTVILFFPDGSETGFVFYLHDVLDPTVGAESVQRNDGEPTETILLKKWRAVCCASRGRWLWFSLPSTLWWLFCRCVCVSCVDAVLQCVQCASCTCRGRSHHYRPRNGDAATMCVSLLAAHLCISFCLSILRSVRRSVHRFQQLYYYYYYYCYCCCCCSCTRKTMMIVWRVWKQRFPWVLAPSRREQLDCVSY
ncbi:hypothetical protein TcCL_ESM09092 [Trypanosoma cruzi]|nr:hypothetical protein TcCL_ESM09092 [Trypanosoma cruzi]